MASLFEQINIWVWIGFVIQIIGRVAAGLVGGPIGAAISILGLLIFVLGCMGICQEKGYSRWWGFLGIFSCIGLLVILVLPEKQ
jgi:hypothetical protein